jgi:hypothetical protein
MRLLLIFRVLQRLVKIREFGLHVALSRKHIVTTSVPYQRREVERHKSRSPAMRNDCYAFICSVFRYPADQLTVFPGAAIPGRIFTVRNTVKKF